MAIAPEPVPDEFLSETMLYDYKTPVKQTFEKIKKYGTVIVLKDDDYFGVVDNRTIAHKGALKVNEKYPLGKFAHKVPVLDKSTSIDKTISNFYEFATKALPFRRGSRVDRIVKRDAVLKAILSLHRLSTFKVEDAMSSPVIAIASDSSVTQARNVMKQSKVNRLVVIDKKRPVGILSYANLIQQTAKLTQRVGKQNRNIRSDVVPTVLDVCQTNIRTIDLKSPIDDAIRSFVENGISSLVVTRRGETVGIITITDVFGAASAGTPAGGVEMGISGLDDYSREYEDDIRDSLTALADRINKFQRLQVHKITLNVKRMKQRNYEAKAKLILERKGIITASAFGYSLDEAMRDITDKLYEEAKAKKELITLDRRPETDELYE